MSEVWQQERGLCQTSTADTPIELVNGDKLVEMFENLSLGLSLKKDYDIDQEFFDQYK